MSSSRRAVRAALLAAAAVLAACGGAAADGETAGGATAGGAVSSPAPGGAERARTADVAGDGDRGDDADPDDEVRDRGRVRDDLATPGVDWAVVDPAEVGLDPVALDAMATAAEAGGSECLVVTKDGQLAGEWYWAGFDERTEREVFSVTKSITSTLVGIAQDRGLLDVDDRASDYIGAWVGTPSEDVTIRNLLSNDSGRFQDFQTDYVQMAATAPDKTGFSVGLEQQHEPGSTWVYNNAAIQTLDEVLEVATGGPTADFADEALFEPLGMSTTLTRDEAGGTLTFMGAQASCRDLARFGLLHLRAGDWDGEQIVSAEWVAEATAPSQELNEGYGFLWWLGASGSEVATDLGPVGDLDGGDGCSATRTYAALGLFRQLVGVYPDDGVVATRLGSDRGPDGAVFGLGELSGGVAAAVAGAEPPTAERPTTEPADRSDGACR